MNRRYSRFGIVDNWPTNKKRRGTASWIIFAGNNFD